MKAGDKVICFDPTYVLDIGEYTIKCVDEKNGLVLLEEWDLGGDCWFLKARFHVIKGEVECIENKGWEEQLTIGKKYFLFTEYSIDKKPMMSIFTDTQCVMCASADKFNKL